MSRPGTPLFGPQGDAREKFCPDTPAEFEQLRHPALDFVNPEDWEKIAQGDVLSIPDVRNAIRNGNRLSVINLTQNETYETEHPMTPRQVEMVLAGSLINLVRQKSHNLEYP